MTVDGRPRSAGGPHPPEAPPRAPGPPPIATRGQAPPGVARRTGRHARPGRAATEHTPPEGYEPRHAVPEAETEQFALVPPADEAPTTATATTDPPAPLPASARVSVPMASASPIEADPAEAGSGPAKKPLYGFDPLDDGAPVPDRVRVVLAERRAPTRAVRTVAEIEEQTETGAFLLSNLMRAQLALGIRLGLVAALLLVALPVLFVAAPGLSSTSVLGIGLPWIVLGAAPYPVLFALAWVYTRNAERNELDFAENVED